MLRSLAVLMTAKVVLVLGFLALLALFHSHAGTWAEIGAGFVSFGTVPVRGGGTENVLAALAAGRALPALDVSAIPTLAALAAIAGLGGLSNSAISNYTRDAGWGMGRHVGAIPSVIGGRALALSHVGTVFTPDAGSLRRWRGWCRHVLRDQALVWAPACLLGIALPSMLSVEFLPRGTALPNAWVAAGMTADGVRAQVGAAWGGGWGTALWYGVLLCGALVLVPGMTASADGVIRRWIDVLWTASPRLRAWDPRHIGRLYFGVLLAYAACGLVLLSVAPPLTLLTVAATVMNFALGVSCVHCLAVNVTLLPPPLRPSPARRLALGLAGAFFLGLGVITTCAALGALS